nr:hypothetical protein [Tanacetum cinerariifolium]
MSLRYDDVHKASGVATSINNAGVANAFSLGGHTLEADVAGAYGSAAGNFVYDVTTHNVCSSNECTMRAFDFFISL